MFIHIILHSDISAVCRARLWLFGRVLPSFRPLGHDLVMKLQLCWILLDFVGAMLRCRQVVSQMFDESIISAGSISQRLWRLGLLLLLRLLARSHLWTYGSWHCCWLTLDGCCPRCIPAFFASWYDSRISEVDLDGSWWFMWCSLFGRSEKSFETPGLVCCGSPGFLPDESFGLELTVKVKCLF